MKKHLSIFSIAIVLTFSFLFIGNVTAAYIKGFNVSQEFLENYFEQNFEGKRANQIDSSYGKNLVFHKEDFPFVNCFGYNNMGSSSGDKTLSCQYLYFITPKSFNTNYITINTGTNKYGIIPGFTYNITKNTIIRQYQSGSSKTAYDSIYLTNNAYVNTSTISYTNFEVYNGSTLVKSKNLVYDSSGKKNISFHLNGGTIIDVSDPLNPQTYQENFTLELKQSDLNTFINSQTPINGSSEFLGWYYDANFTQPYNNSDTLSSDIDLYAKWETPITFNFHLNGGYLYDPSDGWGSEEDFSISLYNSEIEQFFTNLDVKKYLMLFDGWYYDNNYKNIFHINDNFTEDTYNLYAKWRYEKVDDFLDNTNFNEYTFDENYQYAIINRGNNGDSVYLGLPFSSFSLEVYEYNESTYKVKDGSSVCLTPIYTKNGFAIYDLNTLYTNDQEVLILPRFLFDNLDPNDFQDPEDTHHFYLTDNAYVSYTNDLSEADIVDSNGEHITINLQDSYELSQQYQEIYSNPENIFAQVNIFLNKISKITSAIKGVFEYLFGSFNSTIQAFIIFLIVVVLISAIMRFIRRS